MRDFRLRILLTTLILFGGGILRAADAPKPGAAKPVDLPGYRTVATAVTTTIRPSGLARPGQSGYLGVSASGATGGALVVQEIAPGSPAAKAGLQVGDAVLKLDGQAVASADGLRELLQARAPGSPVTLAVRRKDQTLDVTARLGATSRPMTANERRVTLGVVSGEANENGSIPVIQVPTDSPAARAGIKGGDLIVKLDGLPIPGGSRLADCLTEKSPGDKVAVTLRRVGKDLDVTVTLAEERGGPRGRGGFGGGPGGGWDTRLPTYWKKDVYRVAVICIEYPDVKHNPDITRRAWEQALFSRNTYNDKSATGQGVHGSLADYYHELSCGAFRVEGRVFDYVEVGKKRTEYGQGTGPNARWALFTEAADKLLARDGQDALKGFDGIFFQYAGDRVPTNRGNLYWPHRATFSYKGQRWPYFIVQEGGRAMNSISVTAHEFGHMLGLPDLYARPENPGSEGVGVWCAMSNQAGNGRPQHFSAWCKEKLGWLQPAVLDPRVKQKLVLSPVEDSPKECFKILVKPDGSEYFLLENRRKKGFDQSLPAEGLLIWRVVNNKVILEESHGVDGAAGPRVLLSAVPYPSAANDSFTPYTTPSSRSQLGGGLPVHITNIRKLADGRVTFHLGYEYQ